MVDDQLRAALEQVEQRQRAARAFELVGLCDLDHRQLTTLGVEPVALAGEVLLLLQQVAPGGGPLVLRDDLRQAHGHSFGPGTKHQFPIRPPSTRGLIGAEPRGTSLSPHPRPACSRAMLLVWDHDDVPVRKLLASRSEAPFLARGESRVEWIVEVLDDHESGLRRLDDLLPEGVRAGAKSSMPSSCPRVFPREPLDSTAQAVTRDAARSSPTDLVAKPIGE